MGLIKFYYNSMKHVVKVVFFLKQVKLQITLLQLKCLLPFRVFTIEVFFYLCLFLKLVILFISLSISQSAVRQAIFKDKHQKNCRDLNWIEANNTSVSIRHSTNALLNNFYFENSKVHNLNVYVELKVIQVKC